MSAISGNQRIAVAVRTRPILREGASMQVQEKFELPAVHRVGDTAIRVELTRPSEPVKRSTFTFDYIFDQDSTQLEVYEECVVDMIDAALTGVNCSILAYGQTGSGKTFSVLGDVKPNPLENDLLTEESGIFLRVLHDLMEYKLRKAKQNWHVVVGLSCVEIYNENIRDLFGGDRNSPPPPVKVTMLGEDVILPNVTAKEMVSLQAVFTEIQLAISRRASRATDSNAVSSRSHCLFFIDVLQQKASAPKPSLDVIHTFGRSEQTVKRAVSSPTTSGKGEFGKDFQGTVYTVAKQSEPIYASKIVLADLAGSERIARSGVSGAGLAEATSINSSLTALGNVVHSLHEGGFVSYRTSNLTRLLKPTFAHPSSRVLLLAQCAPTQLTFEETISTLHFANKVKAMKVNTTTGSEVEKLQFDFIESAKICDAAGADIRIFAAKFETKGASIRRFHPQNKGFCCPVRRGSVKERLAALEVSGVIPAVKKEKNVIFKRREEEQAQFNANLAKEVEVTKQRLLKQRNDCMQEIRSSIKEADAISKGHLLNSLMQESIVKRALLEIEEGVEWNRLLRNFYTTYQNICTRELKLRSRKLEEVSTAVMHVKAEKSENIESVDAELQENYALSAWYHCTSKLFFSYVVEQRELEFCWLKAVQSNNRLEKWKEKNSTKSA